MAPGPRMRNPRPVSLRSPITFELPCGSICSAPTKNTESRRLFWNTTISLSLKYASAQRPARQSVSTSKCSITGVRKRLVRVCATITRMFGPWCRWASSAAARMTGRFVPTKISSPSAMSRARKAAISSRTAAGAAVTAPASVLIERQEAAQADLLEIVDVGLGPAYVAVEIGLERAAIAGTGEGAPGVHQVADVLAVFEVEAGAREGMRAERGAQDAVGKQRRALGRPPNLLV